MKTGAMLEGGQIFEHPPMGQYEIKCILYSAFISMSTTLKKRTN